MTEKELRDLLLNMKNDYPTLEVAYDHFKSKTRPPFIVFRNTDATTFKADNTTYWLGKNFIVELITEIKDTTIEEKIETIFNTNELPFDKEELFVDSEQVYEITYYI